MIIIHDEKLQPLHVIFHHPEGYEDLIDDEGHRWVQTRDTLPADEIVIAEHPQYGHRKVYHRTHGYWIDVIAMDGY